MTMTGRPRATTTRPARRTAFVGTMIRLLLAAVLVIGCHKGPKADDLRGEIQSKLDRHFGSGVFEISDFVRRGSQPFREADDTRDRLLVYFNAEIRFVKGYKLSNWDQLNVGSLVSVLGATPRGIDSRQRAKEPRPWSPASGRRRGPALPTLNALVRKPL